MNRSSDPTQTAHHPPVYDVLIVGGGAAGLSAAVALGRSLRSVLVIDGGQQRNLPSDAAHNVLGREGVSPADLVAAGRSEATGYGVHFADDQVVTAISEPAPLSFVLTLASGRVVTGKRLILATGLIDVLPDVPGVAERWGHSVIHCPFCHGYEVQGQAITVIGSIPAAAAHQSMLFAQLSDDVTLVTHDVELDATTRTELAALGVRIVEGRVTEVFGDGREVSGLRVDGQVIDADVVVVGPLMHARGDLYEQLGGTLEVNPFGSFIPTSMMGATAVPGVWAAGNSTSQSATVAVSAGEGVSAGAAVNGDLVQERLRLALEAASVGAGE